MNILKNTTYTLVALVLGAGLLTMSKLLASDDVAVEQAPMTAEESGERYLPSDDSMADVAAVIDAAKENNKLALVVMGANWCHDSRALASRLYQEPLRSLVDAYYETIFIDVGYLDKGENVIISLGSPVYYATPTVLIVDPVSGQLVNAENRHQWAEANTISMEDSVEYFQQMASTDLTALRDMDEITGDLRVLFEEIDSFEQRQAERVYKAYAVLGPMLKAYEEGDKDGFSEDNWNEVRDFRYKVPGDVDALWTLARERVAAGETEIKLDYPEYPAFSWETTSRITPSSGGLR